MAEQPQPDKHHVGPISPDMTEAELVKLGRDLFDKIKKEPSEDHDDQRHEDDHPTEHRNG